METNPNQVIRKGGQRQLFKQVVSLALVEPCQHLGQLLPRPDGAAVQLFVFVFALARFGPHQKTALCLAATAQGWLERVKAQRVGVIHALDRDHPQKRGGL
ncbi:hypothetical protein D3C75_703800 [compost metagenome]